LDLNDFQMPIFTVDIEKKWSTRVKQSISDKIATAGILVVSM
jgi:hypothetical protein